MQQPREHGPGAVGAVEYSSGTEDLLALEESER